MNAKLIMTVEQMKDRDIWRQTRNLGIGGSDAGAIMGMNPWKSKYQLWLEKTGQAEPEDISGKESVYWGTVLEAPVADRFAELTGKKIRRAGMMQNVKDPWMLANVDRLIVGEKAGLECKCTNAFSVKDWKEDNLPDSYYWQCQHYMMTTGLPVWYIAVLIGGNSFDYKAVPRHDDDIKALYEAEEEFWLKNVKEGIMPDIDGSELTQKALEAQYPGKNSDPIELPSEAAAILQLYYDFDKQYKEAKAAAEEQKNKLCAMLGDYEIGFIGDKKITWKRYDGRITVNAKKQKKDYPEIYKQVTTQGKPFRKFQG